jgi:subtilisin-like proprotein convertase family protein
MEVTTTTRVFIAVLALLAGVIAGGTASAQTSTFSNPAAISIPDSVTPPTVADPYPSTIAVSGVLGTVTKVTVTLTGLSHGGPQDIDALLVGPTGQSVILMSDNGAVNVIADVNLTFDDAATASLPDFDPITSGTYKPTNFTDGDPAGPDNFPVPAPVGPYGATLAGFNGLDPNGTWSLYILDDANGQSGSVSGGWSIEITVTPPAELPFKLVATGTGPGGGPHVKIFKIDSAGTVTELGGGFMAYDPGFTGGVSVALADFDNDGTPEIVTAPRGNGGPHVRIFKLDKTTGDVTPVGGGFFAYDPGFTGGVAFAIEDLDGDGTPEILTAPNSNGGPHVRAFRVDLATGDATPFGVEFFAYDPGFVGGLSLAAE